MPFDRAAAVALAAVSLAAASPAADDRQEVSRLDVAYQAAVKHNDAEAMAAILHPDFILVLGNGSVVSRQELLDEAMSGHVAYEQQDEDAGTQTVRVFGDTAVVTARLWLRGVQQGKVFDRRLWFSDTYVRTPQGWRYAFGQASMALPPA